MRFKTIFLLFNAVLTISFVLILFLPGLFMGIEYLTVFLRSNWYVGLLFAATLVVVNVYFFKNWRLFGLLEREDWYGVIDYLEHEIYGKRRVLASHVRILLNTYLVASRTDGIRKLERFLSSDSPGLVARFAVQLGVPYLLSQDTEEGEKFFGKVLSMRRVPHREWIRWNHAFCLMQQRQAEAAKGALRSVLTSRPEPVLELLTLYMLDSYGRTDAGIQTTVAEGVNRLRGKYDGQRWKRLVERTRDNVEALMLSKIIEDAARWLFDRDQRDHSDAHR